MPSEHIIKIWYKATSIPFEKKFFKKKMIKKALIKLIIKLVKASDRIFFSDESGFVN